MTLEMSLKLWNKLFLPLVVLLFVGILVSCQGISVSEGNSQDGSSGAARGKLTFSPSSEAFGTVLSGSTNSGKVILTNSGENKVSISGVTLAGDSFELSGASVPFTLGRSESKTLTVTFAPQLAGKASGTVTITSNASNPLLTLPLSGTAVIRGVLTTTAASLSFGKITLGTSSLMSCTISNAGGTSITISQLLVAGLGFSVSDIATPLILGPSQTMKLTVSFAPQSLTNSVGSVTVRSTGSNSDLVIRLDGSGSAPVAQLTINPATIDLGSVVIGTSGSARGSLVATGANITVGSAITNNPVFSIGGLPLPVTIGAGQSVPFTITFSPQVTGVVSAALSVESNAQSTTASAALTGNGAPATIHNLTLGWDASTSPNVIGYNVYRALYSSSCGSFVKLNVVPVAGTLYTDSTITSGNSYCYTARSIDSNNVESSDSNVVVSNVEIPGF